ncbi:hypothetical protein [Rubrivirga litoralis]|uniref:DUF3592 domain-containing protein n=1 Tax=Rubrivirga litoralis TaxID=3075598 RepID=A0ABU3BMH3_9BACT|nr:hypothetical protein [Rubrivirga sp. F394]MDT0630495.1 hypothetical protein [Rubrivirga sp. F394]
MSASTLTVTALVSVVLAWVGLTIWNQAARARVDDMGPEIAIAFQTYFAPYAERGELAPPAYWDFRLGWVVEYPPGVAEYVPGEGTEGMTPESDLVAVAVREDAATGERWPVWMWGVWVGAVPPLLFHGLFGVASLGLLALWLRLRAAG